MKAVVWTGYGSPDVLQLQEVEKPTPKDNELLIKIHATTVTTGDCEMRSLSGALWYSLPLRVYAGLRAPKRIPILGMELAGEIESAGREVKRFKEGDQVFAATGIIGIGTYAEYLCLPEVPEEGALAVKPSNMSYEEAAAVPVGGLEALNFLRQADIQRGQKVLINGAGGTIGPFAVQLAKYFGAEVTGVESNEKLDVLRSIGADQVVDYTREDFTKSDETYDLILDVVGKSSLSGSLRSLNQNGRYLIANPGMTQMLQGQLTSLTSRLSGHQTGKKVIFGASYPKNEDLDFLKELIEAGEIVTIIDKRFPLEQTAEAHRYVETGQKTGNVIVTVEHA